MSARARQENILRLVEKEGYITVRYLTKALEYSSATINRDLNALQARGLLKRTHGGAEPMTAQHVSVFFRTHQMRAEKREIGRVAASLVKDGETVFIDGSTTAQCMAPELARRKDLTVITNNMALAAEMSAAGATAVCLGGTVAEAPSMLCGVETVENAARYRVDKMFFSTFGATKEGLISGGIYDLLLRIVSKTAGEIVYLVDSKKIDLPFHEVYGTFGAVHTVVSDYDFPAETKAAFPHTKFVLTGETEGQ